MANIKIAWDDQGDWLAIVKDDRAIYQGHSIEPERLLNLLGIDYDDLGEYDLRDEGYFPDDLKEWGRLTKV